MHPAIKLISAAALFTLSFATQSAPIYNVISGKLSGISNLDVSGKLYNVLFENGSYTGIWGTTSDFADSVSAGNAASALVTALKSASALPTGINSDPTLVSGIDTFNSGGNDIFIPWGSQFPNGSGGTIINLSVASYLVAAGGWNARTSNILIGLNVSDTSTYGKFNAVSSIPEPTSIVLLATGLVGFWGRKFKSNIIPSS